MIAALGRGASVLQAVAAQLGLELHAGQLAADDEGERRQVLANVVSLQHVRLERCRSGC